jgi:diacylglycerol kinase (ATP)
VNVGVVYNPSAGGGRAATAGPAVTRELERRGLNPIVRETEGPGGGTEAARELLGSVDAVVAVGGDGTVNEVVNGLAGGDVPLGVVPAGTVNVLALELRLPSDVHRACDVIEAGHTVTMDLGMIAGRRFALMTGAGLDALTIRELNLRAKRLFHEAAFVVTGARVLLRHPIPEFRVRADGEEYPATFAVIGNSRYYGGRFGVTMEADPSDGWFDLLLFQEKTFGQYVRFWMEAPLGLHHRHPGARYLKAKKVDMELIAPSDEIWYQTDGELAGQLPATAQIIEGALKVLVSGPSS